MKQQDPNSRRAFLKILGAGTSFLALGAPTLGLQACQTPPETASSSLYELFRNPPAQAKPFYRWWWNGNRVTAAEVERELEVMAAAGAGGVEINPIALHPAVKDPSGEALEWLSERWLKVLDASIQKAKELGMITDLIVGTGWPFGGKFLQDEETIQGFDLYTERLTGPATYQFDKKQHIKENAEIRQALLSPLPVRAMEEIREVTEAVANGEDINVREGSYQLTVISWRNKFREVLHGAPGGDGPVLDHFNQVAVEKYLNRTSDGLASLLGNNLGTHIRSMFCDSIELSGANWTGDFREEFERRNGYDVWPYLSLVMYPDIRAEGDLADTLLRVRYDYYATLSELFMERFILTFHQWCQNIGVKSRYQAYGHPWAPTDLLDGNLIPDIPEGDQWLFNGGWTATQLDQIRYAIWDKYTSSAAHLRGLKIASCEAMTNTSGVFSASLEYIKQATDINIVAGINHLILHGWNYSPPEAGFPGWIRYGTYFSEQNPWFPYLRLWSDYAARLSAVFQECQAVSQVAIIGPTADRWSESGLDRNPFLTDPWYLHSLWQAMNHHGYCSDYLNPRIFAEASYQDGRIHYGPMSYQAVIICDMESAFPEFMDALTAYAEAGGKIIFVGKTPVKSPGMQYKGDNTVIEKMTMLKERFTSNMLLADAPEQTNIVPWAGRLLQGFAIRPEVQFSTVDERLYFYQAEHRQNPVFFFSNQNRDKPLAFVADFQNIGGRTPWQWNAETGERTVHPHEKSKLSIHLRPLESLLLILTEEKGKITAPANSSKRENEIIIDKGWKAEFFPVEGPSFEKALPALGDIARMPGLEDFSGAIIYRNQFETKAAHQLDLGKVAETAEVTLNGQNLGVKWWGERLFDISSAAKAGINHLEVRVTTLLWNYCNAQTMEENSMAKRWANANRNKEDKPLPAGLIGPVKIVEEVV